MLDLIWDMWQQRQIGELKQKASESGARVMDAQERTRALEQNLERLMTTSAAMWSLVKEKTGLTDQDLIARVRRMEEEQSEGRGQATRCRKCGRTVLVGKARCMYCGEEREEVGAFER